MDEGEQLAEYFRLLLEGKHEEAQAYAEAHFNLRDEVNENWVDDMLDAIEGEKGMLQW